MSKKIIIFCKFFYLLILVLILINCQSDIKPQPLIVQPKLLTTNEPLAYPEKAFELGIEGRTVIKLLIDWEGYIVESTIMESSGSQILDDAALKMVNSSVYEPGSIDGVPGNFELHIPIHFKLAKNYDLINDIDNWYEKTLIYQEEIRRATAETISESYEILFYHYSDLAREIGHTRAKVANNLLLKLVDVSVIGSWSEYKDDWPLGFLLYKDYMKRYPESKYMSNSLDGLIKYLDREKRILEHYTYSKAPYSNIYSLILNELIRAYDKKHF
jgi:TonB family protein